MGGIYTVIKTKVPVTVREFGDRYCLIGPLSYKTAPMEVEALEPPEGYIRDTLELMSSQGVKYLFGRWLVEGAPYVLLFDTGSVFDRLDEWKGDLWRVAGIPSPPGDQETNEAILFGYLVSWFLGEVSKKVNTRKNLGRGTSKRKIPINSILCSTVNKHPHPILLLQQLLLISMNG